MLVSIKLSHTCMHSACIVCTASPVGKLTRPVLQIHNDHESQAGVVTWSLVPAAPVAGPIQCMQYTCSAV